MPVVFKLWSGWKGPHRFHLLLEIVHNIIMDDLEAIYECTSQQQFIDLINEEGAKYISPKNCQLAILGSVPLSCKVGS